jgi:hypothetical protein
MRKILFLSSFLPAVVFAFAAALIGFRNPNSFDAPLLVRISPVPVVFFLLAIGYVAAFLHKSALVRENLHGLVLLFLFTLGYFLIASILNKPDINTNNIYFAGDSGSWYQRMAGENGWNMGTRGVHPLAHIIFRPLVSILTIFTNGEGFYANLILLSAAGGGCVFLMWKIALSITENDAFSVLSASLLGLSASHLIFASVIETYIFSTFTLLLFIWLLLKNKPTYLFVATSSVTFGITVTNIVQQILTFLFVRKNIRQLIKVFGLVLAVSAGLNLVSKIIYPVTEYFFIPQNLTEEQRFSQEIDAERIMLVAENLFVYNMIAPQPYLSIRNEMPRFNFLRGTIQNYTWFGWTALAAWILTILSAFTISVSKHERKPEHNQLALSMLVCILFNFLLHIGYGIEPFLYSPNWTYALVLAVVILFQNTAKEIWFIPAWLTLVMLIAINNLWFIYLIARQVSEFIS